MRLIYSLGIRLYLLIIRLISPFNKRAALWLNGRKSVQYPAIGLNEKWVWIHAASLGEFEQGRPIIESLKKNYPDFKIVLTFFSPSGYEVRKNYPIADFITYIPIDLCSSASKFLDHFQPKIAVFIKYEYWYNHLNQLIKRKTPYYFVSAIYRPAQPFFKFYGGWFRQHLFAADYIFCQDEPSKKLLNLYGMTKVRVAGDTRFDRVAEVVSNPTRFSAIETFGKDSRLIVAGSTWPADEEILKSVFADLPSDVKLVIAPHLIDNEHIGQINNLFSEFDTINWTSIDSETDLSKYKVLIINKIGLLVHLYQYGYFSYIGGGFGAGIHNTLEAVAFFKPVVFGPRYSKFREAVELIEIGCGFSIDSADHFRLIALNLFEDKSNFEAISMKSGNYVKNNLGATEIILKSIMNQ